MSKFMAWIDERLPVSNFVKNHLSQYYAPKNFNFFLVLLCLILVFLGKLDLIAIRNFKAFVSDFTAPISYMFNKPVKEIAGVLEEVKSTGSLRDENIRLKSEIRRLRVSNSKIAGIAQPTQDTDAASKVYVDESLAAAAISFSMDSTGLNDTQIGLVLNDLVPGASVANGTTARIHCTTLGGANVTGIDVAAVATKSFIAVDAAGVQNESVLQDIGFSAATGNVTVSVTRALKEYVTSGGSWAFSQNLTSSV